MTSERLTRRECLARGAGAVLAGGAAVAAGCLLYDPTGRRAALEASSSSREIRDFLAGIKFPASSPRISIALGSNGRVEQMVRAAVGGLDPTVGMRRFVQPGDVVLIKPNVGFDRPPHLGATTNPEVLRWVIRLCREAGAARIVVADNPIEAPAACFAKSGIDSVAKAESAHVFLPSRNQFALAAVGTASWPVFYEPLATATKLIGLAPIKDHNLCSASMILKNWYGLLGGRRNQLHQAIHETISDLAVLFSPTLVIADATRVMMRNGPTGGRATDVQPGGKLDRPAIIAAVDPVACDAWCYENLLGRDPSQLKYLQLAHGKIEARASSGTARLGECNWRAYEREGRILTTGA